MRNAYMTMVGVIFLSCSASAASFDCNRATNWRDRLICQTPVLSALDEKLSQLYQQKRSMLSAHGAELLQRSERSWLHYVGVVCPETPPSNGEPRAESAACLQLRYQERLTELSQVAQKIGPFVLNRIDIYAAEPHDASDDTGSVPGFYFQHLAFPQIDNLSSAAVTTWNKANDKSDVNKYTACESGTGDETTEYRIGYVNQHVISAEWLISDYCHEAPHGFFRFRTENLVWDQKSRQLAPNDVFADGWEPKLQGLLWDALLAKGWKPPENQRDFIRSEITGIVIEPDRWLFTKDGLTLDFSAYEGGCYVCNPGTTTVPWSDLQPLLVSGSLRP